ncbi:MULTISPECIES: CGNR zinc finger domain-containing protein [Streptomyces]|uniref:ABATE domain-containing protein n=1 Tax=Streptomyces lonegramiae TaxID=3075524 RepID=A0ABU2XLG8_9ACTN|nr:ABATE domain-containing protein [Streptomyces sp. DSM 41529]MDT0545728.1 ABATE domain-containing protein [Streptomyces sp. DSM 41529]
MTTDDEWLWYGGRVCLDFVNTLRDRWLALPRETLREPADLVRWLRGVDLLADGAHGASESALRSAVALREAIDRAVLCAVDGELPTPADITVINQASAAAPRPVPHLSVKDGQLESSRAPHAAEDAAGGLGLVAQDAIELLLSPELRRVRICGSERCALRFVDRSPAHNRRWCSMTRCGNRTKVRLHQARSRARD